VALAGNTGAICNQATKVGAQAVTQYSLNKKNLTAAKKAKDADLATKAKAQAKRDVQNWAFALKDLSSLVADTTVKKALAEASTQVTKLNGDIEKINGSTFTSVQAKVDKACGKS
jgi:protein involved in temperature-dependent protein secretion